MAIQDIEKHGEERLKLRLAPTGKADGTASEAAKRLALATGQAKAEAEVSGTVEVDKQFGQ